MWKFYFAIFQMLILMYSQTISAVFVDGEDRCEGVLMTLCIAPDSVTSSIVKYIPLSQQHSALLNQALLW